MHPDDVGTATEMFATLEQTDTIGISPLAVSVDYLDLLEHHHGDEASAFETLGKLRDLLR